jgi:3-oxoacyl-[acyl-carrier protein] reductase
MEYQTIQPKYPELAGRVAIVTGSGRGIGQAIAFRLAREGMKVVVNDFSARHAEETAAELQQHGAQTLAVPADVARDDDVQRLIDQTTSRFGTIDLLVNNAANLDRDDPLSIDPALWDKQFAVNLRGPFRLSVGCAQFMKRANRGCIVNISTVGGFRAHWPGLPYDATKAGLDAVTRSMGIELAQYGIRVNGVGPGAMFTYRTAALDDPGTKKRAELIPAGRLGLPLEIAAVVAFLASDDASYIVGQTIYVDGGVTAQLYPPKHPI